ETTNDLRDLIARRHDLNEDYTLAPTDPIRNVIKRMGLYGVSQMVVVEDHKVVGIVDEGDILLAISHDGSASAAGAAGHSSTLDKPVSDFMTRRLETVRPETPVDALMPIFRADRVAIVTEKDGTFYGLITKLDMIHYLRTHLPR
ncbi:MAG: CBS domain-containing protein, partial [Phycisphaerales bacterium]|nr:CBS domain-containing protein [Phycisphaerales bacterium]